MPPLVPPSFFGVFFPLDSLFRRVFQRGIPKFKDVEGGRGVVRALRSAASRVRGLLVRPVGPWPPPARR